MSTRRSDSSTELAEALVELDAAGFGRPSQLTVGAYLSELVAANVVDSATAGRFIAEYQASTYGDESSPRDTGDVAHELLAAVRAASPAACADAQARLEALRYEPEEVAPAVEPEIVAPSRQDDLGLNAPEQPVFAPEPRGRRRRKWLLIVAGSLIMMALGAVLHAVGAPHVERAWYAIRGESSPRYTHWQLRSLRRRAAAHPDLDSAWRMYADHASAHDFHSDAVVALRHLIARAPDDARLLNRLAWLLCTSEQQHVRDPVQALELAERAYAIDSSPNIADTLAEASFLSGDIERAIALEQEALTATDGRGDFYQRQLDKFREALRARRSRR